jgi:hypothetical protein
MAGALERVPFALAISDAKLLKPRWDKLSKPQQVVLKAFYGLPLSEEELTYWSIFQGGATYDRLGYVTSITPVPYIPKEYDTLVLYVGRRSGKTDKIISTAVAYEITLGGHKQYLQPGQQMKVPFIAQTSEDAKTNMNFIRLALEESPLLRKELAANSVASEIRLTNGIVVDPLPANKSVGRGHAIPVWIGDENAFWYTDSNAANPDFEVQRAIQYAQLQFPFAKQFLGTTPWAEQGISFEAWKAGTDGRNIKCDICKAAKIANCTHDSDERDEYEGYLVIHASTVAMGNPLITRKKIIQIQKRDPEAFPRESLAQPLKSVGAWLSPEKLTKAIDEGIYERDKLPRKDFPGDPIPTYVAAIDPAFRKDSFALTITHHDAKMGIVQDYIQYWEPQPGEPLKPGVVLDEIKTVLDRYGLSAVYSDQYQLESLQQLALDRQFTINGYDFNGVSKAKVTGSFKVLLDQERLRLLEHELQKTQLLQLQRRVLQSGNVQIAAPPGKHDDLAMVLMLATHIVLWLLADLPEKPEPVKTVDQDHNAMVLEQIERRREEERRSAMADD